ncbi:MAG: hypothetical protein E6G93_17115 [Alphaproteobacteria bacterium]|nr:MAG: hypothetical protein E6G93_17115 [Alphaproteobacteria bacterium]
MSRFASALFMCVIVTVLARSTGLMPTSAEAASVSKADKIALKEAIVACKAEARGKKEETSEFDGSPGRAVARVLGRCTRPTHLACAPGFTGAQPNSCSRARGDNRRWYGPAGVRQCQRTGRIAARSW